MNFGETTILLLLLLLFLEKAEITLTQLAELACMVAMIIHRHTQLRTMETDGIQGQIKQ